MKEMKITPPEGYEVDTENSTFESIKFKPIKKGLPKSWEELEEISGYWVNQNSKAANILDRPAVDIHRNIFPTKEEAEASIALAQLCQLRDRYNDGWKPNWRDGTNKYCISFYDDNLQFESWGNYRKTLSFKSAELRDEFLENFRDLIEKAKPLL